MAIEKKKVEAIERMKILNLDPKVIEEFSEDKKLNLSFGGALFCLNDVQNEIVHNFEMANDCLVYHVIHDYTNFGELLTLLYVSKYSEEWEQDRADLREGFPLAYVFNLDNDICSEFGSVVVESYNGALLRTK